MSRPIWLVKMIKKSFPGRFLLARTTRVPGIGRLVDGWLFGGDDLIYLPKDRTIRVNQPVASPESIVLPSQVVDAYIERANYHWVMNACICRDSSQCKDYPIDLGCLFLGEAVLGINPALGHLVSQAEAKEHVRRCREAGLVHLIGRNRLDTVWLGVGPGDKLLTICNCCPCCCLWKILPYVRTSIAEKVNKMPGVEVIVTERCAGCGTCSDGICFVEAISLVDGRARIGEACRGCGRCVEVCPNQAIELRFDGQGALKSAVDGIANLVDVS
jgi:ferredoxin